MREKGLISTSFDYTKEDSIKNLKRFLDVNEIETLDAIFNNGAYAIPGAIEDIPRQAFREIFEANVFGYIDLYNNLLPLFQKSKNCRVINCSSVLGFVALPYRGAYNATKFALEGITDTLRRENIFPNIKFITIQPGPIMTNIRKNSVFHFEKWINIENSNHKKIYQEKLMPILYSTNKKRNFLELPAEAVAKKIIIALEAKKPKTHYKVTIPTYIAKIISLYLPISIQDYIFKKY